VSLSSSPCCRYPCLALLCPWRHECFCKAYLQNAARLEHATIANHESPRTTKLYARTREELTFEEVEESKSEIGLRRPSSQICR
jgi:hypothetical protein